MGDFRRQPSKVWWSTYESEELSRFSGFLNWGKGADLSGNFNDAINNNSLNMKNSLQETDNNNGSDINPSFFNEANSRKEEMDKENAQIESMDRGSSSSPSQGSHKSQDSGFSDSELQNNAGSLSPRSSPELTRCVQCKSKVETDGTAQSGTSYNVTVVDYRKVTDSCEEKRFMETAFDGPETPKKDDRTDETKEKESVPKVTATSPKTRKNFISRTKFDTREKLNQIQNQLELSFKLPKKINLSQNLKIFSKCHEIAAAKNSSSESVTSTKSRSVGNETVVADKGRLLDDQKSKLDSEGFKVPQLPGSQSSAFKGSTHLLDLTDIEGPPISSSTPKSTKFQGQESPVPRTVRATEKKATFATIRKLKGLSDKKLRGSVNLLGSFNRCASTGSFSGKEKTSFDSEASVKHWLSELETMYEAEIMTTLQSKSLATDLTRQVTNMADTTSQTVRRLHQKTKIISLEFSKLCQHIKNKKDKHISTLVESLVDHVSDFIKEYVQKKNLVPRISPVPTHQRNEKVSQRGDEVENCHEMITDFRQPEPETVEVKKESSKEEEVLEACEKLRLATKEGQLDHDDIEAHVSNLGRKFTEVVDVLLESHIQALVRVVEEPKTELTLRTALSALTALALEGNHICHLISKCYGIRALLAVCLEARGTAVRVSALRALSTVCCVGETIRQFEQAGGVEIMAYILADEKRSETELSEASAVVAQLTAPWVQDNHSVEGLSQCLNSLVRSLTRIVERYESCETLLLSSAALANLTFMEPRTVWPLLENETAKILLKAVRRQGSKVSVFIQEQAATVIANMASIPECRKHLAEQRAVVALLCFLEIHHSPLQRAPEVSSAERVQQKSAIALSRLCSDAVVAKQVVELQGVNRLVRLCKEEKERNFSDGVLVACLAALRKIVANCGTEALEELNAMELVEPRLLDSFLLYSSKQESYV